MRSIPTPPKTTSRDFSQNRRLRSETTKHTNTPAAQREGRYRRYILQAHVTRNVNGADRIENHVRLERAIGMAFARGSFYPLHKATLKSVLRSDLKISLLELLCLLSQHSESLLKSGPVVLVLNDVSAALSENQAAVLSALEQVLRNGYWVAISRENPNGSLLPIVKRMQTVMEISGEALPELK